LVDWQPGRIAREEPSEAAMKRNMLADSEAPHSTQTGGVSELSKFENNLHDIGCIGRRAA